MTMDPIKAPRRRTLWLTGGGLVVLAAAIAAHGIVQRQSDERALTQWTQEQAQPTVQLARLDTAGKAASLVLPGHIEPFTRTTIYARVSGYLKDWKVDIGTPVKAGQVLATIDTPDLDQQFAQAKADLATAQANEHLAAVTAQRWRALGVTQSVSQQAVDEKEGDAAAKKATADAAEANLGRLVALEGFKTISAPFDGVITARKTDVGALINAGSGAGQELFELSDVHRARIYVQVPQASSAEVQPGLTAQFTMPQYPGRRFAATVVTSAKAIQSGSASMLVELQADNPDGALAPGAYCQVAFDLPGVPAIRLPATALVPADQGVQVAVVDAAGKVAFRKVELGRDLGDQVEVLNGITAADRIIDNPSETLEAGETVRVAPSAAEAAAAPSAKAGG